MGNYDILTLNADKGYMGENNAQMLVIELNNEFSEPYYDFHTLLFDTGIHSGKFSSNIIRDEKSFPAYRQGRRIYCPLSQELTKTGRLFIQVRAHIDSENESVCERRSSVAEIEFLPSIMGTENTVGNSASFEAQVRNAVKVVEENKDIWTEGLRIYQYSEIPQADAGLVNTVVQFTGESGEFENGYFYRCIESSEGIYEWQRINTQPDYELPTASETVKGGVKPGFFMTMNGEEIDFAEEKIRILAKYCACEMIKKSAAYKVLMCPPLEASYKSEDDEGALTLRLSELVSPNQRVFFIPLDSMDDFQYLDFETGEPYNMGTVTSNNIYEFRCDSEGKIVYSVKSAYDLGFYLNNHRHTYDQIENLNNHRHEYHQINGLPNFMFYYMDGSLLGNGKEVTFANSDIHKSSMIYCVPHPNSAAECARTGARLSRQEEGLIGFTADIQPEGEVRFNVIIYNF